MDRKECKETEAGSQEEIAKHDEFNPANLSQEGGLAPATRPLATKYHLYLSQSGRRACPRSLLLRKLLDYRTDHSER